MLNGITVVCDGKTRNLELDKRQAASVIPIAPPGPSNPASEELGRLRKATIYADILNAGDIGAEAVESFSEGQWAALALIAKGKPPSPATCVVIVRLLRQREVWRALVAREKGQLYAS